MSFSFFYLITDTFIFRGKSNGTNRQDCSVAIKDQIELKIVL